MATHLRRFLTVLFLLLPLPALAFEVERVPVAGVEVWLVTDKTLPVIVLEGYWKGAGATADPIGKEGSAALMGDLLDQGAGELNADAFQSALDDKAIQLNFGAGRDGVSFGLTTLSDHRAAAFNLLGLALAKPRFDSDALDRAKARRIALLKRAETDGTTRARRAFWAAAFPNDTYARVPDGTLVSMPGLTRDDVSALHRRTLGRDRLLLTLVGNIDRAEAIKLLTPLLTALPEKAEWNMLPPAGPPKAGAVSVAAIEGPQTTILFGLPGLPRQDKDYMAATVMTHLLGGASFSSRLTLEVREKRGLTYGIGVNLQRLDRTDLLVGSVATKNESAGEVVSLIRAEYEKMKKGPEAAELADAKSYLTGSYPLRFDSNAKIAKELLAIRQDSESPDWLKRRNALVNAVTAEDVIRVANRLLRPEALTIGAAGAPKGI